MAVCVPSHTGTWKAVYMHFETLKLSAQDHLLQLEQPA